VFLRVYEGCQTMAMGRTLLLGGIAAVTIVLGMPVARLRRPAPAVRVLLNALAVGILFFLVWDILSAAWDPVDLALTGDSENPSHLAGAAGYGLLFAGGLGVGLLGLATYERWLSARSRVGAASQPSSVRFGPGTMAVGELRAQRGLASWTPARRLALLIAVGIGLHNFAEGLAIGQSAASGKLALATLLVVGFALHNATEGFGIVAPLAADVADGQDRRPSWAFLLMLAAIGGGPTLVGTAVGHTFTSEPVSVVFLTLAAGSILYVIVQLLALAARSARKELVYVGLLIGLLAGFLTDAIVTAAGV
jgi:zinc transporter, ZIP family